MKNNAADSPAFLHVIECLFFLSGAAALAYQVCWQRILFFSFGTDIESTTIIVSVFMLGLGLGALAGGWAADRWFGRIAPLFALSEFGIGLFGVFSPHLLPWVSDQFVMNSRATLALVNFAVLLLPTALMGATLPMLIAFCQRTYKNIGVSTGTLYCLNTLGAATGCLMAAVSFMFMTLKGVIVAAALINFFISAVIYLKLRARA